MSIASKMAVLCFIALIALTIPALIGVYVYRDAKRRRMNAVLWTLVAVLSPALIGFIIYLLVRSSYSDLECPQCAAPVTEQFVVCPQCGTKLRPACPSCGRPVEPDWRVCPRCAAPLDEVQNGVMPPRRRQDKGLGRILIAVIVAPILLIALIAVGFSAYSVSYGFTGGGGLTEFTFDEYDQAQKSDSVRDAVHSWLDGLELRSDRAYALQYSHYDEFVAKNKYFYLIYVPSGGKQTNLRFGGGSGLLGPTLELELENTGYSGSLFAVEWHTTDDRPPRPEITLSGKRIRCEVQETDYNPTPYVIIPDYADAELWNGQFLPERLSVVKYVGNENVGVVEVTDQDMMFTILSAIDSAERAPMESGKLPRFQLRDGFEIIVEYQIHDGLSMHDDMARHMVLMEDGVCWLDDSRVRNTTHGSSFRAMDEDFYELLGALFEAG